MRFNPLENRRRFLRGMVAACAASAVPSAFAQTAAKPSGAMTKEERDRLTPGQVLDALKKGNALSDRANADP
jgi:hypothetical protein